MQVWRLYCYKQVSPVEEVKKVINVAMTMTFMQPPQGSVVNKSMMCVTITVIMQMTFCPVLPTGAGMGIPAGKAT